MEEHKDSFSYLSKCLAMLSILISLEIFSYYIWNPNDLFAETFQLGWANTKSMVSTIMTLCLASYGTLIFHKKIESILKQLHLEELKNEKVSSLSGGEQQRVAFARAFVKPSEIILCDEPTGNLDSKNKMIILDLLKQLNEDGKTIIIVTHDQDVESIAHHKYRLADKNINQIST